MCSYCCAATDLHPWIVTCPNFKGTHGCILATTHDIITNHMSVLLRFKKDGPWIWHGWFSTAQKCCLNELEQSCKSNSSKNTRQDILRIGYKTEILKPMKKTTVQKIYSTCTEHKRFWNIDKMAFTIHYEDALCTTGICYGSGLGKVALMLD